MRVAGCKYLLWSSARARSVHVVIFSFLIYLDPGRSPIISGRKDFQFKKRDVRKSSI
jgi:hypothetical protein